jgi:hypothetical protein
MSSLQTIQQKLQRFVTKYYVNELIKGAILFSAIGLLYFLLTLLVEHFLWLGTIGRTILFWLFIAVELGLVIKFIALPLLKMFHISKGIDHKTASTIIGKHFPEVNDKLFNLLQLSDTSSQSELLLASIEQKSAQLKPVPFQLAINLKQNVKYTKYLLVPAFLFLLIAITGNINWFSDSYNRVVKYQTAFEPPAPFQFFVVNDALTAYQNQPYTLQVKTIGEVIPSEAQIIIENEAYYLEQQSAGTFEFTIDQPIANVEFYLTANQVNSRPYTLDVVPVPTLLGFNMKLQYPSYTKKQDEVLQSSGNATIPEGTKVTWTLQTQATDAVALHTQDSVFSFAKADDKFSKNLSVYKNLPYQITTSNEHIDNYESLGFTLQVVKDEYPEIDVNQILDSTSVDALQFAGQATDDYSLTKLQLVYYPEDNEQDKQVVMLKSINNNYYQFVYSFPDRLELTDGVDYAFYFEVFDNDGVNGNKSSKSQLFSFRKLTQSEQQDEQLEQQNEAIQGLTKSLDKLEQQQDKLQELSRIQKEKDQLNFNDKRNIENFLDRQKLQDEQMKRFSEQLEQNLDDFQPEQDDEFKELLKERMERQQQELKKNEKLLEELKKLTDKISKEELANKLEQLAKQQQNHQRSLEQILELTKRYYVNQKLNKLMQDLQQLANKQEELSKKEGDENTSEKQEQLNKEFDKIKDELDKLQLENEALQKPMDIPRDENSEQDIQIDQEYAKQKLQDLEEQKKSAGEQQQPLNEQEIQQDKQNVKQSQRKAAQKMKELSLQMQQNMQGSSMEMAMEDMEALRQVLDNLVIYSFEQEDLMEKLLGETRANTQFNNRIKRQNELRSLFEHIDDSLFSLSLRRPEISETINKEITEVFYNIDKALERLPENRMYQGISNQQKAITSSNNLASFLGDVLDNMNQQMQMSMSQSGSQQQGFQLPDIIQSQEQLNQQMQQQMGKQGKEQQQGQQQDGSKEGNQQGDKEGEQGGQPKEGSQGEGQGGNNSENDAQQLYEIYKQQQQLRMTLEKQLRDKLGAGKKNAQAERLIREMEQIEDQLLDKGFNENTLQRMTNLKHELLKLDKAAFQQGEERKRESTTNRQQFKNTLNPQNADYQEYFNQIEILNRQVLPLRQIYKVKVRDYFKKDD